MKNWIRIFLICSLLVGGTAFFSYWLLNQFNNALDDLSASSFAIINTPRVIFSNKINGEQIPAPPETVSTDGVLSTVLGTATIATVPEVADPVPAVSVDLKPSFIFSKRNNELYVGCAYQLFSFQPSTAIRLLETTLIDAGNKKIIDPTASGLVTENKIEPNSQSLDWTVGMVWPGEYYIKVSNIEGDDLRSKAFTIKRMSKDISADEKEKICKESNGSL